MTDATARRAAIRAEYATEEAEAADAERIENEQAAPAGPLPDDTVGVDPTRR